MDSVRNSKLYYRNLIDMGRLQKLIALLLVCMPVIVQAQWSIGGSTGTASNLGIKNDYFSFESCGYTLANDGNNWYADVQLDYRFAKRWSVRTGFRYTRSSFIVNRYCISYIGSEPFDHHQNSRVNMHYGEIPVNLLFDFVQTDKVTLALSGGIVAGMPLVKDVPEIANSLVYNNVFALTTGLDLTYNVTERFGITLQAGYQFNLLPTANFNPHGFRAGIGFVYRFGSD